jgi:hypothetical protein
MPSFYLGSFASNNMFHFLNELILDVFFLSQCKVHNTPLCYTGQIFFKRNIALFSHQSARNATEIFIFFPKLSKAFDGGIRFVLLLKEENNVQASVRTKKGKMKFEYRSRRSVDGEPLSSYGRVRPIAPWPVPQGPH